VISTRITLGDGGLQVLPFQDVDLLNAQHVEQRRSRSKNRKWIKKKLDVWRILGYCLDKSWIKKGLTMEVRFNVTDDEFMERLQNALKVKTAAEVVKQALTLLNWVIGEVGRNRIILSSDLNGQNVHRLVMPALDRVKDADGVSAEEKAAASRPTANAR